MGYVNFKGEKSVFLGLFFNKKKSGAAFSGDKLAVIMSDPAYVNFAEIDENTDFINEAVVQVVKMGDCIARFTDVSTTLEFVSEAAHRHLCYKAMDKVDRAKRTSEMILSTRVISLPARLRPDPAALAPAAFAAPAAPAPAAPPAPAPAKESPQEGKGTAAAKGDGGVRKSARPRAKPLTATPAATPASASAATTKRGNNQKATLGVKKKPTKGSHPPKQRVASRAPPPVAKKGSGRAPRAEKAKPHVSDSETLSDEEPQELEAVPGGTRPRRHVNPPVVETRPNDGQGVLAKQVAEIAKSQAEFGTILVGLPDMIRLSMEAQSAPPAVSDVAKPQGKKRGHSEQPDATVPRSPPNQRTESVLETPLDSPTTEFHRATATAEERYHSRATAPAEARGPVAPPQAAPPGTCRPPPIWFPHPRSRPEPRRSLAVRPIQRASLFGPPEYPGTPMPSGDPVTMPTQMHIHYHGDNLNPGHSRGPHYPGPSHGPPQPSAQPRGYPPFPPFSGQMQMQGQMQMPNAQEWYHPAYMEYNP